MNIEKAGIEQKLTALKIPGTVTGITENAFYKNISVCFAPEVTYNKIKARQKDLEIFFGASVELETENGQIIFKVANKQRHIVGSYDFLTDIANNKTGQEIPLIIGESQDGQRIFCDLAKAPHVLVGGATGSGKSVYIHNAITSILYGAKSALCLIDVKQVEFSLYEGVRALSSPIATTSNDAKKLLKNLCCEMDNRYLTLKKAGCRSIQEFTNQGGKMQYITVVIDELADLIIKGGNIDNYIIRLCQLGRAAGIHLIVATQRPDAEILSGLIRSNIPTRICFAVQKSTDSRIILDTTGGERLQGAGDGLYKNIGCMNPIRFQTPFIPTDLLKNIVNQFR